MHQRDQRREFSLARFVHLKRGAAVDQPVGWVPVRLNAGHCAAANRVGETQLIVRGKRQNHRSQRGQPKTKGQQESRTSEPGHKLVAVFPELSSERAQTGRWAECWNGCNILFLGGKSKPFLR